MRSIDNVYIVADAVQYNFSKSKGDKKADLELFVNSIRNNTNLMRSLDAWKRAVSFKGKLYPTIEEYTVAKEQLLAAKREMEINKEKNQKESKSESKEKKLNNEAKEKEEPKSESKEKEKNKNEAKEKEEPKSEYKEKEKSNETKEEEPKSTKIEKSNEEKEEEESKSVSKMENINDEKKEKEVKSKEKEKNNEEKQQEEPKSKSKEKDGPDERGKKKRGQDPSESKENDVLRYRVTCERNGKHSFESNDVAKVIGGELQEKYHWIVDLYTYHLEIVCKLMQGKKHTCVKFFKNNNILTTIDEL